MRKLLAVALLAAPLGLWLVPAVSGQRDSDPLAANVNLPPGDRAQQTSRTGNRTTLTTNLVTYNETYRVQAGPNLPARLDEMRIRCHGGTLRLTWQLGNLEPTHPDTGIHLTAYLDGKAVGSLLKGSTRGIWNDGPVQIESAVNCPGGQHKLWVSIDSIQGSWGIPYANEPDHVQRGFIAEEIWRKNR